MTIQLNINLDEFEKFLTPELMEIVFHNAGYKNELKDEYKNTTKGRMTLMQPRISRIILGSFFLVIAVILYITTCLSL